VLLGDADAALGVGERVGLLLGEPAWLVHQRPPLLQEEARERLVLRAHHPEPLGQRRHHFAVIGMGSPDRGRVPSYGFVFGGRSPPQFCGEMVDAAEA
jgi:hypothetical protein